MHKLGQVLCSHHKDESCLWSKYPREAIMKTCKYSKIFPGHSKENIYLSTVLLMFQMEIIAKTFVWQRKCADTKMWPIFKPLLGHKEIVWDSVISFKLSWCEGIHRGTHANMAAAVRTFTQPGGRSNNRCLYCGHRIWTWQQRCVW